MDLGSREIVLWSIMDVAKTKTLISCAVTAKLICTFVWAYAKSRFSHDAAQLPLKIIRLMKKTKKIAAIIKMKEHYYASKNSFFNQHLLNLKGPLYFKQID